MISKELLSEVLGIRSIVMDPILEPNSKIGYLVYGSQNTVREVRNNHKQINIYELAHKCKEWAKSVYNNIDFMVYGRGQCDLTIFTQPDDIKYNFNADTEVEAIFKACQWILDNGKTNSLS